MNYKIGPIQDTMAGSGFVISDKDGRQIVAFGYSTLEESHQARARMIEVIRTVKEIRAVFD